MSEQDEREMAGAPTAGFSTGEVPASAGAQTAGQIPAEILEAVAFVGDVLAPFFNEDPEKGKGRASLDAIAAIDPVAAGREWPFVDAPAAQAALALMRDAWTAENGPYDVTWEYRRLFVGPAAKVAPPWGSVYTDYEQVIFGASTLALRSWIARNGVVRPTDGREPEDHIGLMLALMSWLARNRPELLREFLRDHLLTWSGHFLGIVRDKTDSSFYRGLAELTAASLNGIQARLGIRVEYPRFYR